MITKYLFWFLGALIASTSALSQIPVVLHPRVGETIDIAERSYFGLFPTISSFYEARIYEAENDGMLVEIVQQADSGEHKREIMLDARHAAALSNYLDRYEFLLDQRNQLDPILKDLVFLPYTTYRAGKTAVVTLMSGERIKGRLLCVGQGGIAPSKSEDSYDWRDANSYTIVRDQSIKSVHLQGISLWKSALIGAALGSGVGAAGGYTIGNDEYFLGKDFRTIFFGTFGFVAGGLVGTGVALTNPSRTYRIDGEQACYSASYVRLKRFALYAPPPELLPQLEAGSAKASF